MSAACGDDPLVVAHHGPVPTPTRRPPTVRPYIDEAELCNTVYRTKVADGSTVLTHIHHRQTPLFLMQGVADAGVTWQSEVMFQQQAGHPIEQVTIPAAQNTTAVYAGAEVKGAMHPEAAQAWLAFIRSAAALAIFERYGFKPYVAASR